MKNAGMPRPNSSPRDILHILFVCDLDKRFDGFRGRTSLYSSEASRSFRRHVPSNSLRSLIMSRRQFPGGTLSLSVVFSAPRKCVTSTGSPPSSGRSNAQTSLSPGVSARYLRGRDCTPVLIAYKPLRDKLGVSLCNYTAGGARRIAFFVVYPDVHAAFLYSRVCPPR